MTWIATDAHTPSVRRWALIGGACMTLGALVNAIAAPTIGHVLFAAGFPVQLVGAGLVWAPRRPWLLALGTAVTAVGAGIDAASAPTLGRVLLGLGFGMLALTTVWQAWRGVPTR